MVSVAMTLLIMACILWMISLFLENCSIVDGFWALFFLISALLYQHNSSVDITGPAVLLIVFVMIWSLRLSIYLLKRNWKTEDRRYVAMRLKWVTTWRWRSFFQVFLLQATLAFVIGMPFWAALHAPKQEFSFEWVLLGSALWGIGFLFEAVADYQLSRFKAKRRNLKKVLNTGLWRYSRHPNYFGEAVLWWGFGCFGVASGHPWTLICPLLMTVLLLKVSGVPLLEKGLQERRFGYDEYMERTPSFVPWLPKKKSASP